MKYFLLAFILIIVFNCSSKEKNGNKKNIDSIADYKVINSKDIEPMFLTYENGKIIDTLYPSWLGKIKTNSLEDTDTNKILLPNCKIALDFARLMLNSIYRKNEMDSEMPFNIYLVDEKYWDVTGTLPKRYDKGGVAEILFSKYDCKVLYLLHGK